MDAPVASESESPDRPELVEIPEAAAFLGISEATAKRLAAAGELPGCVGKLGGRWRISRTGLHEYAASYPPIGEVS